MRHKAKTLACLTAAASLNSAFATNGYFTHGIFAPKKTITGNNLFDPTQTLDLSMRQFELEFSMRF